LGSAIAAVAVDASLAGFTCVSFEVGSPIGAKP